MAEQIRHAVARPLASGDGKRVPSSNYHITLAFYGSADTEQLACLQQLAETIHGPSFQLILQHLGYWPKPKVIWLAPTVLPEPLIALQSGLSQAMVDNCAYQAEKRPYRPHLTLTRKTRHAPKLTDIEPILWKIDRFTLIRSITHAEGTEYQLLNDWLLA